MYLRNNTNTDIPQRKIYNSIHLIANKKYKYQIKYSFEYYTSIYKILISIDR